MKIKWNSNLSYDDAPINVSEFIFRKLLVSGALVAISIR
jgi:hypothetical protein